MVVTQALVVAGAATAGGIWLTREVLERIDPETARWQVARAGAGIAERVGHVVGAIGRSSADTAERLVTRGGQLAASGTGAAVGVGTAVAARVLFVHRASTAREPLARSDEE